MAPLHIGNHTETSYVRIPEYNYNVWIWTGHKNIGTECSVDVLNYFRKINEMLFFKSAFSQAIMTFLSSPSFNRFMICVLIYIKFNQEG